MEYYTVNFPNEALPPLPIFFNTAAINFKDASILRKSEQMTFHQIFFVVSGEGLITCNQKSYPLFPGCAFYVAKGVEYSQVNTHNLRSSFLTVVGDALEQIRKRYAPEGFLYYDSINTEKYSDRIAKIKKEHFEKRREWVMSSMCYSILVDFFEELRDERTNSINKVYDYIGRKFQEKLTLDLLCRVGGISESKLCHDFKKLYGVTVFEQIISLRLDWAKSYLVANPHALTKEVASLSGFDDISYFCRLYKKKFGTSPKDKK